jgi:hypothetical protein
MAHRHTCSWQDRELHLFVESFPICNCATLQPYTVFHSRLLAGAASGPRTPNPDQKDPMHKNSHGMGRRGTLLLRGASPSLARPSDCAKNRVWVRKQNALRRGGVASSGPAIAPGHAGPSAALGKPLRGGLALLGPANTAPAEVRRDRVDRRQRYVKRANARGWVGLKEDGACPKCLL